MSIDPNTGHAAGLLPAQVQTLDSAIAALPTETLQQERQARADSGLDTTAFDRALASRQAQPLNPAIDNEYRAYGVSRGGATAYAGVHWGALSESLTPERLDGVRKATSTWASQMQFSSERGVEVINRIVQINGELRKMDDGQRAEWTHRQQQIAERVAGSPEKAAELKAAAIAVVNEHARDNEISVILQRDQYALADIWLIQTLASHGQALKTLGTKYKK